MMKKAFKSIISLLLVTLMLIPMGIPSSAASGAAVPTVYCQGQGSTLVNANGEQVYPLHLPDGGIMAIVEECMPLFINALTKGEYDAWYDKLREEVIPLFADIQLDNNGESVNGVHIAWGWNKNSLKGVSGVYYLTDYMFESDWRLDPFDNADILHAYITDIKERTGSEKVNLIGRCEGANIVMAYLAEYGYEDINCVEIYISPVYGMDAVGTAFSGNFDFDTASLEEWMDGYVDLGDDILSELLYSFLSLAQSTGVLSLTGLALDVFAMKLYNEILPELLLGSFGTFPGIWAMVDAKNYEDAKEVIFGGKEDEYAGLIAKLDDYNVRVRQRADTILQEAASAGVKIAVFAKYGYINFPLDNSAAELSDGYVTVNASSFGATCAPRGQILSDAYIADLTAAGNDKYLSPDSNIDASTCLFPDTTGFIKNSTHVDFPNSIHVLMEKFLHSDGTMTVFSDPSYPQYMIKNEDDSISPYAGEPIEDIVQEPMSIRDIVFRFVNALLNFIFKWLGIDIPGIVETAKGNNA